MLPGYQIVTARRAWFVPGVNVWGLPSLGDYDFLASDKIDSTVSYYYGNTSIGECEQEVLYSQLTDHRGNSLPATVKVPRVIPRLKGTESAFVVGTEAVDRFKIARDSSSDGPVTVDLLILEMGD